MVIVLLFQEAATPAGSPLAPVVPAFTIPVAPVVVWVIFVNALLIVNVGVDEGLPAVFAVLTVIKTGAVFTAVLQLLDTTLLI